MFSFLGKKKEEEIPCCGPWFLLRDFPPDTRVDYSIERKNREMAEFSVANAVLSGFLPTKKEIDVIHEHTVGYDYKKLFGCSGHCYAFLKDSYATARELTDVELCEFLNEITIIFIKESLHVETGTMFGYNYFIDDDGSVIQTCNTGCYRSYFPFDPEKRETVAALENFRDFCCSLYPGNIRFATANYMSKLFSAIPNEQDFLFKWRSMTLRLFSRMVLVDTGLILKWQNFTENEDRIKDFPKLAQEHSGILFKHILVSSE